MRLAGGSGLNDTPAPLDVIDQFACPVLGIFGGADQAIPVATVQQFRDELQAAGVEQEIVVEPDAPHSFFDKKSAEYQAQSEDAWNRVCRFIENHGAN
jgi:carboxymethylenebutenolidase